MSSGRQNCIRASSSREPPETDSEPVEVVVRCSSSGFRLLTVLCVGWGGSEEKKGMWGAGPVRRWQGAWWAVCSAGARQVILEWVRASERGSCHVGLGSPQIWQVREAGRGCGEGGTGNPSPSKVASASAFSLQPPFHRILPEKPTANITLDVERVKAFLLISETRQRYELLPQMFNTILDVSEKAVSKWKALEM